MDAIQSLTIIRSLADGVNPYSGKVLSYNGPYQQPDTVRALHTAIKALEKSRKASAAKNLPGNSGTPWDKSEERRMVKAYNSGKPIKEIAKRHERTEGAIMSRLVKLGVVEE